MFLFWVLGQEAYLYKYVVVLVVFYIETLNYEFNFGVFFSISYKISFEMSN